MVQAFQIDQPLNASFLSLSWETPTYMATGIDSIGWVVMGDPRYYRPKEN